MMAFSSKHNFLITLVALTLSINIIVPTSAATSKESSTNFVVKSCKTTTYSSLCVKTLLPYASTVGTNPLKLCKVALKAAVLATYNCSATVTKLAKQKGLKKAEAMAVKDCIGDLKDAITELKDTLTAMTHMNDGDREFQWANAKTYASAAITDADTCVDGILDRKVNTAVRNKIKSCATAVEKHMSNALALINHLY
ncbi:pectinesterase inhibitor 4-like [Salvia miltiorrhiza]|uniref:pectinesterase inhibitor 4-like n=1 Tax=Salvia miltiorrhiza TaxID=226208 RepID=UPI0025AC859D|nr:pectinesterase inhibitor 4-like [Salvia miltiorrhiza]